MPNGNNKITVTAPGDEAQAALAAMMSNQTLPDVIGQMFGQPAQPPSPVITNAVVPTNTRQAPANIDPTTSIPPGMASFGTGAYILPAATPQSAQFPLGQITPAASSAGPLTPGWNPQRAAAPTAANLPASELPPGTGAGIGPALTGPLAGSALPMGGTVRPAGATPINLPQPTNIPPESAGRKFLNILGKIGGYGLSAIDPGLAAMIPQTPLGRIAAQERALTQAELANRMALQQAQAQEALAGIPQKQAAAAKDIAEAEKAQRGEWKDVPNTNALYNSATHQIMMLPPGVQRTNLPPQQTPLTPSEISQYNPILKDLYMGQNPKAGNVPPNYQLGTGATQGDYERIVAALEANVRETEARTGLAQSAGEAQARLAQTAQTQQQSRADRNYFAMSKEMDAMGKPVSDMSTRLSAGMTNLNLNSPQADALLAPEILSIAAGGAGSGLRMNAAEINRIVGGATMWTQLQAAANKWSTDPNHPQIPAAQRQQMAQILQAAQGKLQNKQQVLDWGNEALITSQDIQEQRQIVADVRKQMEAIDNGKIVRLKQNAQ